MNTPSKSVECDESCGLGARSLGQAYVISCANVLRASSSSLRRLSPPSHLLFARNPLSHSADGAVSAQVSPTTHRGVGEPRISTAGLPVLLSPPHLRRPSAAHPSISGSQAEQANATSQDEIRSLVAPHEASAPHVSRGATGWGDLPHVSPANHYDRKLAPAPLHTQMSGLQAPMMWGTEDFGIQRPIAPIDGPQDSSQVRLSRVPIIELPHTTSMSAPQCTSQSHSSLPEVTPVGHRKMCPVPFFPRTIEQQVGVVPGPIALRNGQEIYGRNHEVSPPRPPVQGQDRTAMSAPPKAHEGLYSDEVTTVTSRTGQSAPPSAESVGGIFMTSPDPREADEPNFCLTWRSECDNLSGPLAHAAKFNDPNRHVCWLEPLDQNSEGQMRSYCQQAADTLVTSASLTATDFNSWPDTDNDIEMFEDYLHFMSCSHSEEDQNVSEFLHQQVYPANDPSSPAERQIVPEHDGNPNQKPHVHLGRGSLNNHEYYVVLEATLDGYPVRNKREVALEVIDRFDFFDRDASGQWVKTTDLEKLVEKVQLDIRQRLRRRM